MTKRSLALIVCLAFTGPVLADDWPHWRGPLHDAVWREDGIIESLPAGELDFTWRVPCELGYAGPAVADGRVYLFEYERSEGDITDNPGARDKLAGVERLRCLASETGEELWRYEYDRPYFVSYPSGPRCTPTVDGDRVYVLGTEGDLTCLHTAEGSVVWRKSFTDDYGAPTPQWGHSAHPLVDGDTLYCLVGGEGSVAVALDKLTGEEKWRSLSTPKFNNVCGYCPPTMIRNGERPELIVFHPEGVAGLDPATGAVRWIVPIEPAFEMSIAQPIKVRSQGGPALFVTGYGGGSPCSVCLRLPAEGSEAEVLWQGEPRTSAAAANASPVDAGLAGGYIYAIDAHTSTFFLLSMEDGARVWESRMPTRGSDKRTRDRHGTAFVVRQGEAGPFWIASETGELILADLTQDGYAERGRKPLVEPTGDAFGRPVWWSHPAFAERSIFARNDKELVRVNLSAE